MSNFISSMFAAGLMEIPPASKVTPLPTITSGFRSAAPPRCSSTISRGSWSEPCDTASSARIPSSSSSRRPRTVTRMPRSRAIRSAVPARYAGVTTLGGRLPRSRASRSARATTSPMRAPSRSPSAASPVSASSAISATCTGGSPFSGRDFISVKA